jgi:uncharacterized membrane protein YfcA
MADLQWNQLVLIGLVFVWSGFVRSGLGFGGAVLALPFLLLIVNDPLIFLPIISVHLLIFSAWIAWKGHYRGLYAGQGVSTEGTIHWQYLRRALRVIIIPKLLGVIGLLTLSPKLMSIIIFMIVLGYAMGYIINRPIRHQSKAVDVALLSIGGYISGTSLTGAPLLITVFAAHVPKHQLRDTLFVLWFILTLIKLISFVIAGVDLQLIHHLWLLPCALVGHVLGERVHEKVLASETPTFFRILGVTLVIVSGVGLWQAMA